MRTHMFIFPRLMTKAVSVTRTYHVRFHLHFSTLVKFSTLLNDAQKLNTKEDATEWCSKSYNWQMSPTFPLLIFILSCLSLLTEENIAHGQKVTKHKNRRRPTEQAKNSQTYKVRHKNRLWKIKTINEEAGHPGFEFGEGYQEGQFCFHPRFTGL